MNCFQKLIDINASIVFQNCKKKDKKYQIRQTKNKNISDQNLPKQKEKINLSCNFNHPVSSSFMKHLLVFLTFLTFILPVENSLVLSDYTANAVSNYELQLFDEEFTLINAGSVVIVTFPTEFTAETMLRNQPYSGTADYCFSDCSAVTISYFAYKLVLNNMFPSPAQIAFRYVIHNIRNPPYAVKNVNIVIEVKSGDLLTTYLTENAQIQFLAPQFDTLSLSLRDAYLWGVSQLDIDLSVSPLTNSLKMVFPLRWQNETLIDSTVLGTVLITSSTHSISYARNQQTFTINIPPITSSVSQILKLTFKSVYTPSAMIDMGSIVFSAVDYQKNVITQSSASIPSSELTADFSRQTQSIINYDQTNNQITIRIKFRYPRNAMRNDKFMIEYPPQITIATLQSNYKIYISNTLISTTVNILPNNSILVAPFSISYFQPDIQVSMTITWPRSLIYTSNFKISTFRPIGSSDAKIQETLCCALWIKQKPTLQVSLQISNSQRLKSNVQYIFNLTHSFSTLTGTDFIIIQFPAVYKLSSLIQSTICSGVIFQLPSNSSNLNPSFVCSLSSNILKFSSIFKFNQAPALLIIKLSLANPSQSPNENFQIWSQDSSGAKIERNDGVSLTISAASLGTVSVTPSSLVTMQKSIYHLSVTSIGTVSKNSVLKITIPSQIDFIGSPITCKLNTVQQFCSLDKATRQISILVSSDLVSTSFTFQISNLINPQTFKETQNFKVEIFDPSLSLIESSSSLASGLSVQMTSTSNFDVLKMWTDSSSLDQKGMLKFLAVTKSVLQIGKNYKFRLLLSTKEIFNVNDAISVLKLDGSVISYTMTNTTSESEITFTFSPMTLKDIYEFQLSQVFIFKDSLSLDATLLKQVDSVFYESVKTSSAIKLQDGLNAVLISDYEVSQDSYFINQSPGSIVLKINPISPNLSFSNILIKIPKNYQSLSGSYEHVTGSNTTTISFTIPGLLNPLEETMQPFTFLIYNSENQIVAISQPTNQYFQTKCEFPCRDCKSPSQPGLCVDCYQISSNQLIYFRQTVSLYGQCVDHCVSGEYLDLTLKKCLPCSSNCSSCLISLNGGSGDPEKCTTCQASHYLLNERCYQSCPDGYYLNDLICSQCIHNCNKCAALFLCTECSSGFFLFEGKCLLSCPLGTFQNQISLTYNICSNCSLNCLICTGINSCTLCQPQFYLYDSLCYSACPIVNSVQLYPNKNNTCTTCQCRTCTQYSYKCLSCQNGIVYSPFQFKCKTKCDDGYYNSSNICAQCPSQCLKCSTFNNCTLCKEPYSLNKIDSLSAECVLQCPQQKISTILSPSQLLQCLPCINGCSQCQLSPSFCTQCSNEYLLYNNKCLNSCPAGYHNISGYCKICVDQCRQCQASNPRNCTVCSQGYFLSNSFCYGNCPQGTYPQNSIKKCLTCQSLCETCMNATHCTSCKAGYYLFPNNLCYSSCPTTPVYYYTYNSQCMLCQPQCTSCLNSPVECSSCSSPYFYQNEDTKQCSTTCQDGYFVKNNMCVKCQTPCLLCDTTYDSCLSCRSDSTLKYVYQGKCLSYCPLGYYGDTYLNGSLTIQNKCMPCQFTCLNCSKTQCFECESFAFKYKQTCVLDCSTTPDMPFQKDNYCTNCIAVPFCSLCDKTQTQTFSCWQCTYPYVLFQGQCLNACPQNYEIVSDLNRTCIQSYQAQLKKQQTSASNKQLIPFPFLIFFFLFSAILYPLSKFFYEYTYHTGYQIFLVNLLEYILVYYWLINFSSKYEGQYFDNDQKSVPLIVILVGLIFNLIILGWLGFGYTLRQIYFKDVCYSEWKKQQPKTFVIMITLLILFGPKTHKIFYSKLFGSKIFSYRIISVEKFNLEDRINFISIFGDLVILSGFFIAAFNVFIQLSGLYTTSLEIFFIKIISWALLIYDSKKPDRGFFYGDQKVALQEIQKEEQEKLAQLRRIDTDHLIKLIRRKSAAQLTYDRQPFGQIEKAQFISVYNPDDYEDVPKVPFLRIEQNIRKGKFRKGRKITVEQKLERFADSIKPKPKITNKQEYIHGMIYWKPPKKIKETKKQKVEPLSEESMLKMLEDKQIQYKEELQEIENIVFEEKQTVYETINHNFKTGQFFYKNNDQLNVDTYNLLDSSNASIQQFQDLSSQIFKPSNEDIQYNDLMNLNYARKKHLAQKEKKPQFDDNQLRILYHQPKKRRVSKLKN